MRSDIDRPAADRLQPREAGTGSHRARPPARSARIALLARISLLAMLAAVAIPAFADPHRCTDAQGHLAFQDTPCPTGTRDTSPPAPSTAASSASMASRVPESFNRVQRLGLYAALCNMSYSARVSVEILQADAARSWPADLKIDKRLAMALTAENMQSVQLEIAADRAGTCARARREIDAGVRRVPGGLEKLYEAMPELRRR